MFWVTINGGAAYANTMSVYNITYQDSDRPEFVRGHARPIFIHNGSYFLETLDIYEDAIVDCWGLIPLDDLKTKIKGDRAQLRSAYEAVPKHKRTYTQRSMDDKDHAIRHILRL